MAKVKTNAKKEQLYIVVGWQTDHPTDKNRRQALQGRTMPHVGDCPVPDLTHAEMQQIALSAKLEFRRVMMRRLKSK